MKNKILTLSCMIIFMISILCSSTFAAITSSACSLNISKNQYNTGEKIVVTLRLDSLTADRGIIAYSAVLDYDKNALQYESCSGIGDWVTPSYNEENGMLVADRNNDYSPLADEDLCTITFIAKSSSNNAKIKLSEITLSNGGNTVGNPSDVEKTISITGTTINPSNPTNPDNPANPGQTDNPSNPSNPTNPSDHSTPSNPNDNGTTNNNTDNTTNGNNNNGGILNSLLTANQKIPNLGANFYLITLIVIALIVAIVFFIRIKVLDMKIIEKHEEIKNDMEKFTEDSTNVKDNDK